MVVTDETTWQVPGVSAHLTEKLVKIRVRQVDYLGKAATVVCICDATRKIKSKIDRK